MNTIPELWCKARERADSFRLITAMRYVLHPEVGPNTCSVSSPGPRRPCEDYISLHRTFLVGCHLNDSSQSYSP